MCQRDEARREMSLSWLRIIVLKALFKPLLTKLKHLACGTCVPTCRLKGMHEDGWFPGGGGWVGVGEGEGEEGTASVAVLAVEVALAAFCFCAVPPPRGRGAGRKPLSRACLYAGDILLRRMYPCPFITQALKSKRIQDLSLREAGLGGKGRRVVLMQHIFCARYFHIHGQVQFL